MGLSGRQFYLDWHVFELLCNTYLIWNCVCLNHRDIVLTFFMERRTKVATAKVSKNVEIKKPPKVPTQKMFFKIYQKLRNPKSFFVSILNKIRLKDTSLTLFLHLWKSYFLSFHFKSQVIFKMTFIPMQLSLFFGNF